jgi:hypothetical protein
MTLMSAVQNQDLHSSTNCLKILLLMLVILLCSINSLGPVAKGETVNAQIFITPPAYIAKILGETFSVNINISNVKSLHGLQLALVYNSSLLEVVSAVQGAFFPSYPGSSFQIQLKQSVGIVKINASLTAPKASLNGNGTLACISFKVAKAPFSCTVSILHLNNTSLSDSNANPIPCDSVDSVYFWKSPEDDAPSGGAVIDEFTQKGGVGQGTLGGFFLLGETVNLTSRVTYNSWPLQNKLVGFEVISPDGQIVLVRTAMTDVNGFARISFKIRENADLVGYWTAISVTDVDQTIVWDITIFQVTLIIPVGGYSFSIKEKTTAEISAYYPMAIAMVASILSFAIIIREKKRKMPAKYKKGLGKIHIDVEERKSTGLSKQS